MDQEYHPLRPRAVELRARIVAAVATDNADILPRVGDDRLYRCDIVHSCLRTLNRAFLRKAIENFSVLP